MNEEEKPGAESSEPVPEAVVSWEEKAQQNWEAYLRAVADADNQRKRYEKQIEDAHKYAVDRFARELLPVVDSLEMALESPVEGADAVAQLRQGVENTLKLLLQALAKAGIAPIEVGEGRFDPHLHQAIAMVEGQGEANRILAVHQKGYLMSDRLLRPSMVSVSKAAKPSE
ncbi:nucleotide exchange factor GrpE [Acidithiobacillus sulfuriphilus]|jgi:molecular chaperone GrpE|uniref:Protein GrpE n=2 Tax=Acidithiobacillus sulfuriphilus TaxID=1867749 RepID=A0A3M8QWY0_9PROT|nr:nucleotide exchange factor GrpE [Acidithiobacillus sulfuriphilus]MCL5979956.1 nucleotide exchange factor GrpE [Gammaproteobacteria bacterium]RNF60759.1 nucleotide exchange factor GrpE [Acidithiobacillus sulfuriphilus]